MSRRVRVTALLALNLALLARPLRAAPAEEMRQADLEPVFNLANKLQGGIRCEPVVPGSPISPKNLRAAAEYAHLAGMYALAALHYPAGGMKGDRVEQINAIVVDASVAYERAYECAPDAMHAFYLQRAVDLIKDRISELIAREHQGPDSPAIVQLTQRSSELQSKIPVSEGCPRCPAERSCPVCQAPPPLTGYQGLYSKRLSLAVGLGGGLANLRGGPGGQLSLFTARFALGPRILLGTRKRHVVGAGLEYHLHAVLRYSPPDTTSGSGGSTIHQAGPYVEYALLLHRHFAFQLHGGIQVTAGAVSLGSSGLYGFHAVNMGGGAAGCTLNSALCLRVHGFGTLSGDSTALTGYLLTLNLDAFRIADYVIGRTKG